MQTTADADVAEQVVRDRRHLHQHPELGFQEHQTAAFVAERLGSLGIEVRTGVAETGVVGLLRGGRPGKTVLLRADMDALPIDEANDVPYKSQNPGVMHACGHDGHTAILLNAAQVLSERRDNLPGTVKLVFQPCEERPPGGAIRMIEEGVLDDPTPDAVFGLHLSQVYPAGTIVTGPGPRYAAADVFRIVVVGKGGHAAYPHLCIDPVLAAAQVVSALHTIVAREVKPNEPAVITVGKIQAGTAPNVIPNEAVLEGTLRTLDRELRERLVRRVEEVAVGVARAMRADCRVEFELGYPPVVNDPAMAELAVGVARELVGDERVLAGEPAMPGDDMAYFLERVPGCYFNVGSRNEARGLTGAHHQPRYDIDEEALPVGVEMLVRLVERYLVG